MERRTANGNGTSQPVLKDHRIVDRDEWVKARKAFLLREKEFTRLRDQLSAERRALPWTRIEKDYVFEAPGGRLSLTDLFAGRRQLLIQHFMLGPGWGEGCRSCSYMADHTDSMNVHLAQRNVTMVAVSRAPIVEIERFRKRMGWRFDWVSSYESDFNHDFGVSFTPEEIATGAVHYNYGMTRDTADEMPGISAFYRNEQNEVFHTYSTYARGVEAMMGTYALLDLMPEGRAERDVENKLEWVRHHDRYAPADADDSGCGCR